MHSKIETTYLNFPALDQYPLAGTLFEPKRPPLAAVLISSATGVPQRYYAAYARFLAEQGFAVLTYDYRGIAGSRWPGWAVGRRLRMRHWGEQDMSGALEQLRQRYPGLPLLTVGHSVGGQLLGLTAQPSQVTAQLTVASQAAYWRHWPLRHQPRTALFFFLVVPAVVRLLGKLPASMAGEDLPAGVALEWARWGRHPAFFVDDQGRSLRERFARFTGAMRLYAIADDHVYAPAGAVAALAAAYTGARTEIRHIGPQYNGGKALGHFGFFRAHTSRRLWQETADWLQRQVASPLKLAA
jgi:predicted alpha/beta hydrolase